MRRDKLGRPIHPIQRNSLRMWQKGESGNPNGRPKGSGVSQVLRDRADMMADDGDTRPLRERMADVIIDGALSGDVRFVQLFLDRTEGKVADRIAGFDGGPLGADTARREVVREIMGSPELLSRALEFADVLERTADGSADDSKPGATS